jgi:hypothetical protein
MNTIKQDELYEHLSGFLKSRGVVFQDGAYTQRVRRGCALLTEAINLTQRTVQKAKVEVDAKLEQMRQVIHEKTAPRTSSATGAPASSAPVASASEPDKEAPTPAAKTKRPRKPSQKRKSPTRRKARG